MNVSTVTFAVGVEPAPNVWPETLEMPYAQETASITGSSTTKPIALEKSTLVHSPTLLPNQPN